MILTKRFIHVCAYFTKFYFLRNLATVPSEIDSSILSFCQKINSKDSPRFIPCTPSLSARRGECFQNVLDVLETDERLVYGWIIWKTSSYLLQAEFHGVKGKNSGEMECVTPYHRKYDRIVFLPDVTLDHSKGRVETRYYPMQADGTIQPFIDAVQGIALIEEYVSRQETVTMLNQAENHDQKMALLKSIHEMESAVENYEKIVLMGIGPNSPCICNSGKKFKKCCGQNFN